MSNDYDVLKFPCKFPIKVMGKASIEFEAIVVSTLRKHVPDLGEGSIKIRYSKDRTYVSLTATIQAISREQLDNIYIELNKCDEVIITL